MESSKGELWLSCLTFRTILLFLDRAFMRAIKDSFAGFVRLAVSFLGLLILLFSKEGTRSLEADALLFDRIFFNDFSFCMILVLFLLLLTSLATTSLELY